MAVVLSNLPEIIFEVAWTSTPFETAPVWVDESAYVRVNPQVSIRRGRQSELDEFSYGTLVIELANRDRRFDPTYSAGPLFGNLLPRKQCRFRLRWDSTTYDVFHGWITNLPQNYARGGTDATITIEAVDSLAMLGEMGLALDLFNDFTPTAERHMQSFSGATWIDRIGGLHATPDLSTSTVGTTDLVGSGGRPARGINSLVGGWRSSLLTTSATSCTASFWMQVDGKSSSGLQATVLNGTSGGSFNTQVSLFFANGTTTTSRLRIAINNGASDAVDCGYGLFDGQVHHVAITITTGKLLTVYVDGVQDAQTTIASSVAWYMDTYATGATVADSNGSFWLQDVQQFGTALTATQVAELYNRAIGKIIEPTTTRAARILDNVGWPAAWRDLAPTTGLGAARGECADVQQSGFAHNALTVCAATEQGRYFAKKNGYVAFYGRYYAFEVTRGKTVQATFSDDGAGISYEMTGMDWSDREVNNDVTVNWSDGEKRSTDSASITALSRQSKTITTVLSTSTQAADMAAGLVQWRKDMTPRTRGIVVSGATQTAQWPTILGLEIGDRIRHEITPMAVGSQDGRDLTLEAIEWSIGGDVMHVTFYGSPIPADVFVLDSSLLDTGRLGF